MSTRPRAPLGDVMGRKQPERMSEYFDFTRFPEKADLKVKRFELNALMEQYHRAQRDSRWFVLLWRFLRRPLGSGPLTKVRPTQGEIKRGEATPG